MDEIGYIHELSEVKTSKKGKTQFFNFNIQVAESMYAKAVCFHTPHRSQLQRYFTSGNPVKLRNVLRKPNWKDASQTDVIINKRSKIEEANNVDVQFENIAPPIIETQLLTTEEAKSKNEGEVLSIRGRLAVDDTAIEYIKLQGEQNRLNNAAAIIDAFGK